MSTETAKAELRQAWDQLIADLQAARDVIDNPALFPPEATERVLAEGYRYLSGFIHHGVERAFHEDPDFPAFRNALSIFNKSTIENPDAIYFYAPIDGRRHYRVTGRPYDCRHWQGKARKPDGKLAPQYLIFEVSGGPMAGDTGKLAELMPGARTGFGTLDSSAIELNADGDIELILGPDRPAGYEGHFISTLKPPSKDTPDDDERVASYISGRQLFYDWDREEAIHLSITALEHTGHPPPIDPAAAADKLRRMGSIIRGQMHFWMDFYDKVLNVHGSHGTPDQGRYFFPVNAYNRPNAAAADTGGGMSTNIYAGGIYELAEDEALYVEARFSGNPVYSSFHLGNLWGESPDYTNHHSCLNLHQMHMGDDGVQRWVVAHKDPGVKNWLDTTGLPKGFLSHRWAYSVMPPEAQWPTISARKVSFDEIDSCFPDDMPRVSPEERAEEVQRRRLHVQRRYRVF